MSLQQIKQELQWVIEQSYKKGNEGKIKEKIKSIHQKLEEERKSYV